MPIIPGPEDVPLRSARAVSPVASNAGADTASLSQVGRQAARIGLALGEKRQRAEDAGWLAGINAKKDKMFVDVFDRNKNKADSNETDFLESFDREVNEGISNLLTETEKDGGFRPSDSARQRARAQLASERGNWMAKATTYENNVRVEKLKNTVNDSIDAAAFDAYNNPDSVEDKINYVDGIVTESSDLFSDPVEMRRNAKNNVSIRYYQGLIETNPARALQELRADGGVADNVETGTRIKLINQAQNELNKIDARTKNDVTVRTKDAIAAYTNGLDFENPPSQAEFVAAYGAEEGDRRFKDFEKFKDVRDVLAPLATMDPNAAIESLKSLDPTKEGVGKEGFAADMQRYQLVVRKAQQLEKAKQEDPASFVIRHQTEFQKAYEQMNAGEFTTDEYAKMMKAEQDRLGVIDKKLLPEAEAKRIIDLFNQQEEGAENAAQLIRGLEAKWKKHWPDVYQQLSSDLPPVALVIATGLDPATENRLARIANIKTDELKAGIDPLDTKTMKETLTEELDDFKLSLSQVRGGERTFKIFDDQMQRLALSYMADGISPGDAATQAYETLVGSKYDFVETYRIPKKLMLNKGDIEDAAELTKRNIDLSNVAIQAPPGTVIEKMAPQRAEMAIRRDGYWKTNETETGLVLYYNGDALVRKDNSLIEVSFDELAGMDVGFF